MMSGESLVLICELLASLAALIALVTHFWPCVRLDEFRQSMFATRDDLFDFAASGQIAFDDQAYRLLRHSMNGFIRYAHQLTFFRLLCTTARCKVLDEAPVFTWTNRWESALKDRDPEVVKVLQELHSRALYLVVKRVVTGSPFLMGMVAVLVLWVLLRSHWVNLKQVAKTTATEVVNRVIDTRLLEEEAARA